MRIKRDIYTGLMLARVLLCMHLIVKKEIMYWMYVVHQVQNIACLLM
jgi:hypothetical protein